MQTGGSGMYCNACGSRATASQRFCNQCGKPLETDAQIGAPAITTGATAIPAQQVVIVRPAKSPGLAAVLSFFVTGLGHIYAGDVGKGIALFVVYALSVGMTFMMIGWLILPFVWIYGVIDAYKAAERTNAAMRTY